MPASRADGPRRGAREVYEQGEDPLYIPRWMRHLPWQSASFCRSGPCPRKRWFRSRRFLASTAFAAMAPSDKAMGRSYKGIGPSCTGAARARHITNPLPCGLPNRYTVRRTLPGRCSTGTTGQGGSRVPSGRSVASSATSFQTPTATGRNIHMR
jgi:hypothetical protein